MIGLDSQARIWLCTEPTDMRKSFRGLSALVRNQLKHDPLSGQYFVFVNRRKTQMKMLYFTATGYCLWAKRLEQGQFRVPLSASGLRTLTLTDLQLLIDGNCDFDKQSEKDAQQFSAMHTAACNGHDKCVKLLIEQGANKEARNDKDETPLITACRSRNTACVRELIDGNANVFADRKDNGATGLHLACMSGNREIVKMRFMRGYSCRGRQQQHPSARGSTVPHGCVARARPQRTSKACSYLGWCR